MLAKDNPDIKEAVVTIHQLTEDEKVRQMCERREKALFIERSREHFLAETQAQLSHHFHGKSHSSCIATPFSLSETDTFIHGQFHRSIILHIFLIPPNRIHKNHILM